MKDINFLDGNKMVKKTSGDSALGVNSKLKTVMTLLMVVFISLGGGAYYYLNIMINDYSDKIIEVNSEMKKYSKVGETKKSIQNYNEKIQCMTEVIKSISTNSFINTRLIQGISSVMPENVFLLNYFVSYDGDITLEGSSKENQSIAYFAHKLNETELFEKVEVKSITNDARREGEVPNYSFLIEVKIKH